MMNLSSTAFHDNDRIPAKYTCNGQDVSPELKWEDPPVGTQSFALILDDPDAPLMIFNHWVIYNIPTHTSELAEALPKKPQLSDGSLQGKNGFFRIGYNGPCPPGGKPHRYQFTLYALDIKLEIKAGISKKQLLDAMKGHILDKAQLTGLYNR